MKKTSKLFFALAATVLSVNAFAAKATVPMTLSYVDNTTRSGDVFYGDLVNYNITVGPTIEKNGGTVQVAAQTDGSLQAVGMFYADGSGYICQTTGGDLALNPALYTGDVITINMALDAEGNLDCACTGSACDVSASHIKKIA